MLTMSPDCIIIWYMDNLNTYQLDPDFRKDAPLDEIPFCVRCQKPLKGARYTTVLVNWGNWEVRQVKGSTELMGMNCWKIISK